MPEYRVVGGKIRVMHLDLDQSWWKRGESPWERDVAKVESVIRQATGLRRITKRHARYYVELRLRQDLAARAVAAVMMEFGEQSVSGLLADRDDPGKARAETSRSGE